MSELFTPGPWHWDTHMGDCHALLDADGRIVLDAQDGKVYDEFDLDSPYVDVSYEDGRLIAAAPDLYAALCKSPCPMDTANGRPNRDTVQHCYETGFCVCSAHDALAKVRGEMP